MEPAPPRNEPDARERLREVLKQMAASEFQEMSLDTLGSSWLAPRGMSADCSARRWACPFPGEKTELRLANACELLATLNAKVIDVALTSGYQSNSVFLAAVQEAVRSQAPGNGGCARAGKARADKNLFACCRHDLEFVVQETVLGSLLPPSPLPQPAAGPAASKSQAAVSTSDANRFAMRERRRARSDATDASTNDATHFEVRAYVLKFNPTVFTNAPTPPLSDYAGTNISLQRIVQKRPRRGAVRIPNPGMPRRRTSRSAEQ